MSTNNANTGEIDPWAILDTLPEYLAVLDASGVIRYLNAAWHDLLGDAGDLRAGDAYMDGFERVFAASDIDVMAMGSGLQAILAGERESLEIEYPYESGGRRRWFVATARPCGAAGRGGALIQHREITRRREVEARLHESEAELRALFAAMTDIIFVIDAQGHYLKIGPTSSPLLDGAVDTLVGKTFHEIFPGEQADTFLDCVRRALETRQTASARYRMAVDGAERWFAAAVSPLRDDRVVWVARDISELEREGQRRLRQEEIIEQQAAALMELSTPLIPLSNRALLLPLIGSLDSRRAHQVMETLLQGIAASGAQMVILDITGVPVVDTHVAGTLIQVAQAARLLGARVMLTGIRPEVAQSIVGLGIDLSGVETRASLQDGIAATLRQQI